MRAKISEFRPSRICIAQAIDFTFYRIIFNFSLILSSESNIFLFKKEGKNRRYRYVKMKEFETLIFLGKSKKMELFKNISRQVIH